MMTTVIRTFALALVAALSACNGGGDSDDRPSNDAAGPSDTDRTEPATDTVASPTDEPARSEPVITLLGDVEAVIELGTEYVDPGASASDPEDGDISGRIVTGGTVDTTTPGVYSLTYNVSDSDGQAAAEAVRTVEVVAQLELVVDPMLELELSEVEDPDGGALRPVGAVQGLLGRKAQLVRGELLIATDDVSALEGFLGRWPAELAESVEIDGAPDLHTVLVDTADVPLDELEGHIEQLSGLTVGELRFSSDDVLRLYAIAAREMAENALDVTMNWVTTTQGIRSGSTAEEPDSGFTAYSPNAFEWPYMRANATQRTGVTSAWQMLDLLGTGGTARIMIVDSGFVDIGDYADAFTPAGAGWGSPSSAGCDNPSCTWHGTYVAHVAAAVPDNGIGVAGSAGPYGRIEPVQFTGFDFRGLARIFGLLLSAPINGPPAVVNVSGSVSIPAPFNVGLNRLLDPLFDHALDFGVLVVAAAGNDGEDVDDSFTLFFREIETSTVIPCETSSVVCVGGLTWDSNRLAAGSNYGSQAETDSVDIYASYDYWLPDVDQSGVDLDAVRRGSGTSYSAPFVSGVLAMMRVFNPSLDADDAVSCLLRSAHQGDGVRIHSRGGNQRRLDAFEAVKCAARRPVEFPLLSLDSPVDGSGVRGREELILNAASLGEGGLALPIVWSSNLDGELGTYTSGRDTVERGLSIGTHTLTATVTDEDGGTASESVTVTVRNNPPTASILSPSDGESFGQAQSIPLRAVAEDVDAAPSGRLEGSQIRWSVVGTGVSATGESASIPAGRLGVGSYTLRLVADDGTDSVERSVGFTVAACAGECPVASIVSPRDAVFRTRSRDADGRLYVDVRFEGGATDAEDGPFAGRVNDGPMRWTSTNEAGAVTNLCTPTRLEPPLVPETREVACEAFTQRYFLDDLSASRRHVITLEVVDSDGNRATDSAVITIEFELI